MSHLTNVRRLVDRAAPGVARAYRKRRDVRRTYAVQETPWGFTLAGDPNLAGSRAASHEAEAFEKLITDADHVIDVGANVGLFTLLAHAHGVPVTALEPSPMNLEVLYGNLRRNSAVVEVLPVAVSDGPGIADLYGGGQGASLLRGWGGMASTYATPVATAALDDLFADRFAGKRLVIKVDVEGAELPVLRGATRLLDADPAPAWIVEVGLTENFDGKVNPDFGAIFGLFWERGYTAHAVEAERPVTRGDVDAWIASGDRGFWNINYRFTKD